MFQDRRYFFFNSPEKFLWCSFDEHNFLFTFISPSPQKYKDLYVCVCIYTCMYIRTLQELYLQIYLPLNLVLKLPFYSDVELEAKSDPFGKVFLNWMLSIWERGIFTLKREDTASLLWIQQSYGPYPSVYLGVSSVFARNSYLFSYLIA